MLYAKGSSFEPDEWSYLTEKLRISSRGEQAPNGRYDLPAVDLLDATQCAMYLDRLAGLHDFSARRVTASVLAKRYGFLIVSPALYAMSVYNKMLEVKIAPVTASVTAAPTAAVKAVRVRKTCCYFYQMKEKGSYCPTCPKIHCTS
ncbi:ferric iron reductase protein FhuF [Paenibacillus sp. RC254]|uniref:(2Fe-2S)-binding protein n=1 Tax=unclassified Paenibacillus TaxID=185978 RepID=UPI0024B8BACC|nr:MULTISPECIES: (2Fe-2S)-binding protein [unclassified Paenibacillus]